MAEIQQEASNAVKLAKQAAEWERKATAATKQIGIIMEAAKQAGELAEAAKREADAAEMEAELAEIARREAGPTEAIEAAEQASKVSEQAKEAAKRAAEAAKQTLEGKKLAEQAEGAAKRAAEAAERAEQAARQAVNYQREDQGDVADPEQGLFQQSSTQLQIDCETQTCQTEANEAATQVSAPFPVCYVVSEQPSTKMKAELFHGDDEAIKFYTGLSSWKVFHHLVTFLHDCSSDVTSKLSPADGILLTLMRLRLNLRYEDLSHRFSIGSSTASDVFHRWIDIMHYHLKFLIKWPTQVVCCSNLPEIFKALYPRTRCIIDCSEIFIERPCSYQARAQTYSNYKKHNTIKFLVGITPCGAISFLSKCWGGRATDKCITMNSGFLQLLEPGDVILADRGFDIDADIALHGAKLEIPSYTRGKKQLSMKEVEHSKRIAKVRIHVERVIGLLKNKYAILQSTLPVCVLKVKTDVDCAFIDRMLFVCAALINLSPTVVPLNCH